jgi:hypothetical protein
MHYNISIYIITFYNALLSFYFFYIHYVHNGMWNIYFYFTFTLGVRIDFFSTTYTLHYYTIYIVYHTLTMKYLN